MISTQDEALQWCIDQGVKVLFLREPTAVQIYTSDPYDAETLGFGPTLVEAVQDAIRTIVEQDVAETMTMGHMDTSHLCECGDLAVPLSHLCQACQDLIGTRDFTIKQKVRIIRRETWQGKICTITKRSIGNPNMYWLREHGWRRCDEIEAIEDAKKEAAQWALWKLVEALGLEQEFTGEWSIEDKGIAP